MAAVVGYGREARGIEGEVGRDRAVIGEGWVVRVSGLGGGRSVSIAIRHYSVVGQVYCVSVCSV